MMRKLGWTMLMAFCLVACRAPVIEDRDGEPSLTDFELEHIPDGFDQVNAEAQLAEAAAGVSRTLNSLAAVQRAKHPEYKRMVADIPASRELSGLASIHWVGPVEPLLTQMSKKLRMRFVTYGQRTATPIIVSVDAKQQPVHSILQDVSYQVQNHAVLHINAAKHLIELRYLDA